ncbi:HesA/MoeB/ThiF family protein [Salipiger sp. PrR002]|uniref:HesA/MoeB/ThiF family protein n=1 Tax=Salipiger sp. PrR002 TaxID=2706489 RepID=UPI0013B7F949|nr:HesA/MoeB/ThiF family protein [Salipiger sp. PrR002]NDW01832.1 HesA/MoeB/ThiF family protein [Salipiger sp. PrR002]NDW57872.1 HesA/MoeB/ThiF family protein [Salipiger sp. PrR004]
MSRYARQICLPGVGAAGQARLAAARVLVVGAGGLGSALLPLLAGAGVGAIRIVDPDVVEESNLHRQTLYAMADLGRPKAEVAAERLAALNPGCTARPRVARLDPALAGEEIRTADLVVDAADSVAVTYALSDLCLAADLPLISASVVGTSGYVGGFCGGAPSYRAVFPDLPGRVQSCASAGVMGPVVAALGALQAQMALAVLLGHVPSPLGQMLTLDAGAWRPAGFRFDGAPEPEVAGPKVVALCDLTERDRVIDLRGPDEAPHLPVPWAERMALEEVGRSVVAAKGRTVLVCASGLRAWRAAQGLLREGARDVVIAAAG